MHGTEELSRWLVAFTLPRAPLPDASMIAALALLPASCAAFATQRFPLGPSLRATRARQPLLCAADDRCGAISLAEVGEVAERLGCKLAVNSVGPGYKLELLWGDDMAGQMIGGDPSRPELLGASDGFTQPTGVAHLETIQLRRFTGYWRRSWSRRCVANPEPEPEPEPEPDY